MRDVRGGRTVTGPNNYVKTDEGVRCGQLRAQLREEKRLRELAEKNARQWHALYLRERVRTIAANKDLSPDKEKVASEK